MALTFALISSLAVVSSEWVIQASNTGRHIALIVMAVFALSLISARVGDWLTRPFVALHRLDPDTRKKAGPMGSVMLGVATGLLWAPCAGPILGVISDWRHACKVPTRQTSVVAGLRRGECAVAGDIDFRRPWPGQPAETLDSVHRVVSPGAGVAVLAGVR